MGVVVGLLGALLFLLSDKPAEWLVREDALPPHADVVLVMSGDPGFERTTTAVRLMTEGRARLLILTGDAPWPGDSAASLGDWAVRGGVPREHLRLVQQASPGTWSAMVAVRPLLEAEGAQTIVLVTSPYHQRRAHAAARKALGSRVQLVSYPARPSFWSPHRWWRTTQSRWIVVTEYLKLGYYTMRGWA